MGFWSDYGAFWQVSRRSFRTTGAVMPSSPFLAKALASALEGPRKPAHILEVGPGTGAVTKAIARQLRKGDRLDCVELNQQFADRVRRLVETNRVFDDWRDQIKVIHAGVEELPGDGVYDFIISGLPFNSFPSAVVRRVFEAFSRLLKPGGVMSYFEYEFIRQLQTPFVNKGERRRLYRVGRVVSKYIKAYQVRRERVFMNVPPAIVRHLHMKPMAAAGSKTKK
jgi:phosphatidylethanolamine/phosphatidyl-N-methylethanolamine N-methyltransferase